MKYLVKKILAGKLLLALMLSGSILPALPVSAQEQATRIAVVDLERVAATSKMGQALTAKLQKFQKEAGAEVDSMTAKAAALRQQIADGASSLSEERLTDLQKQFEDASIDIRRFRESKQREGQKMQQEGLVAIEKELQAVFKKFQSEQDYDVILNNKAGVVVRANERVDITPRIIELLNSQ